MSDDKIKEVAKFVSENCIVLCEVGAREEFVDQQDYPHVH